MANRFLITFVMLFIGPAGLIAQSNDKVASGKDEYDVYSALITHLAANDDRGLIVIADPACCGNTGVSLGYAHYPYQQSAPVSKQVFEDFRRRNVDALRLQRSLKLKTPYVIVDIHDIDQLVSKPQIDFGKFYAKYPESRGFVRFSRPGFNEQRDHAFIFACLVYERRSNDCRYPMNANQDTCENCWFVVLAKKKGVWSVTNKALHTVYPT
jgi:hypothetical protein